MNRRDDTNQPLLLGMLLRSFRRKAGLTQEELAARANFHPTYINMIERGRRTPVIETVFQLAKALDLTQEEQQELIEAAKQDRSPQSSQPSQKLKKEFESILITEYHTIKDKELYHYIAPLRCTNELAKMHDPSSSVDPLLQDRAVELLTGDADIVFILGEAGSGKTWFMKQLFCTLLDEHLHNNGPSLPIYVDLAQIDFDKRTSVESLELLLSKQYGLSEYLPPNTSLSREVGVPLLVLMDGYDEAVANSAPGAKLSILKRLFSVLDSNIKIVVTSRSHLFETEEMLLRFIQAAKYGAIGSPSIKQKLPALLFVKPLREEDIRAFLRREYSDVDGRLWSRMRRVIDLPDLAKRPMLLKMVCDSLGEISSSEAAEPITAGYLYRIYTSLWLSRDGWRLEFGERAARQFFEELALKFHNSRSDFIYFPNITEQFPDFFPGEVFSHKRERIEEALRTATFLINNPRGEYRFAHRSFLEYFLAERIGKAIMAQERDLELEVFPSKVTDGFLQDQLKREMGWETSLLRLVQDGNSPILRYLMSYLINRLASPSNNALNANVLASRLPPLLKFEKDPVVLRELLVTLTSHGIQVEPQIIIDHLANPIPYEYKVRELKEYYGSLEEAREYLRGRLWPSSSISLRLFYLISLATIPTEEDRAIFLHYAEHGDRYEQIVAGKAIKSLSKEVEHVNSEDSPPVH
jgi:transcriptional regulator with XRE-family HTH domain